MASSSPAITSNSGSRDFPPFSYVVDAVDAPDVLFRKNLTLPRRRSSTACTIPATPLFRPEDGPAPGTPHPTGMPDGFQAPTIPETADRDRKPAARPALAAAERDHDAGQQLHRLRRPERPRRVRAGRCRRQGHGTAHLRHQVRPREVRRPTPNNLQTSLVGMFFHVNWLHDRWYEAGFDEASGNAQKDNFGLGGLGRRPDPGRGQRLQRHRQRQHVHARRWLQPPDADVRVRRPEPAAQPHQQP